MTLWARYVIIEKVHQYRKGTQLLSVMYVISDKVRETQKTNLWTNINSLCLILQYLTQYPKKLVRMLNSTCFEVEFRLSWH